MMENFRRWDDRRGRARPGEQDDRRRPRERTRLVPATAFGALLGLALAACQTSDQPSGGYPSLGSVPDTARASLSVEERRQIVRELIDERDRSRQHTAIVRGRSGLGDEAGAAGPGDAVTAETVIPDDPAGGERGFQLGAEDDQSNESVYRGNPEIEDGGLDDFIRQLKRDTNPLLLPLPSNDAPPENATVPETAGDDETSFLPLGPEGLAGGAGHREPAVLLAAFAPGLWQREPVWRDVGIRLAANGDEPGFWCKYFGWAVAWSSTCLNQTEGVAQQDSDEDVTADLDEEGQEALDETEIEAAPEAQSPPPEDTVRERVERNLSEEEASEAIEDASRGVLGPVTSSLEKLRDYLKAHRMARNERPLDERVPPPMEMDPATQRRALDRPPIPNPRPERRQDMVIVDAGETFDFNRTPLPAFKPTPDEPVILPPAQPRQSRPAANAGPSPSPAPPKIPEARPNDLVAKGGRTRTFANRPAPSGAPQIIARSDSAGPSAAAGLEPIDDAAATPSDETAASRPVPDALTPSPPEPPEAATVVIMFEPEKPGVPEEVLPRLAELLAEAEAEDQKIYIIGEASSNHLARRRATDVGAALVQLGATVEVLEYDHQVGAELDQVRLILRPAASESLATEANPAPG